MTLETIVIDFPFKNQNIQFLKFNLIVRDYFTRKVSYTILRLFRYISYRSHYCKYFCGEIFIFFLWHNENI